jgi:hypothetical protein
MPERERLRQTLRTASWRCGAVGDLCAPGVTAVAVLAAVVLVVVVVLADASR